MTTTTTSRDIIEPVTVDQRSRRSRVLRGKPEDPRWVRPALLLLLLATGVLYIADLGASGWANSFYSAAVQAGSHSWKAFFFGSSDASNFITVDKPPASLWVMELSARIFGVNSWSILVPQALEGVATVALLYATVRRWFTPAAGLIAGAVLALTPVAVLMFRFNNPDALLALLLVAAAYAFTRAMEHGGTRWLMLAGSLVGFGFLAKMMQAFLVVPAFGLVYLIAAPPSMLRRIRQLLLAGVAMLVSAGWWVAAVALTPASMRPYIGGSQHNSILELIFGYNGLGRLTGHETGSVTGGATTHLATAATAGATVTGTTTGGLGGGGFGGGGFGGGGGGGGGSAWGPTGVTRLFNAEMGTQISWLIPAALVVMVGGLWVSRREARTGRVRAAVLLWGATLLVTGLTISLGKGIIHPYYTVALAPAIGALIGIGGTELWRTRGRLTSRAFLSAAIGVTTWWAYTLLDRTPSFESWLRPALIVVGSVAALAIWVRPGLHRMLGIAVAAGALFTALAAPAAYAIDTAATPHTGSIPSAGPSSGRSGFGGPGGQGGRGAGGGPTGGGGFSAGPKGAGSAGGAGTGGFGGQGIGGGMATTGAGPTGTGTAGAGSAGAGATGTTRTGGFGVMAGGGAAGGLLQSSTPSAAVTKLLKADASAYTWVAAAVGSNSASGFQLASGYPVMAIGGFNGSDPAPSLTEFETYVSEGKIHYFIADGGVGTPNGGSNVSSQITAWVESHYTATTVGGVTLYDLTKATSATSSSSSSTAATS
jgi:4-amino-4-deoxy-L-arabinose transferase-like glycosyltransferase